MKKVILLALLLTVFLSAALPVPNRWFVLNERVIVYDENGNWVTSLAPGSFIAVQYYGDLQTGYVWYQRDCNRPVRDGYIQVVPDATELVGNPCP